MIKYIDLGETALDRIVAVNSQIRNGRIKFAGDSRTNIYGLLNCASGKRTKVENKVFFKNEEEALIVGFRPCSHCMNEKYKLWKEVNQVN